MKKFVWLADSCEPRSGGKLIKGETYPASAYPEAVVEYWIKSGAAAWAETPKKSLKEA
jgi:hypothetical protein